MGDAYAVAFKLLTLGFSVIPSGGGDKGKAPIVNWTEYQSNKPTEDDLERWERELRPKLWGIVTGAISGTVVIDTDTAEAKALMGNTKPHVIPPRKGGHYYYKYPGYPVKTVTGLLPF